MTDIRRATDTEIATAHAWVAAQYDNDGAPQPGGEYDAEDQAEYEKALEIIIFANGGRTSPPPAETWAVTKVDYVEPEVDPRRDLVIAASHSCVRIGDHLVGAEGARAVAARILAADDQCDRLHAEHDQTAEALAQIIDPGDRVDAGGISFPADDH